ncbi:hypothetical protein VYF65_003469 [Lysinibacillus irui]|uniref:hypothetical protein n=1 Tax=Lysinibacillus irui TaxID=2998077 RepID=UPI0038841BA6
MNQRVDGVLYVISSNVKNKGLSQSIDKFLNQSDLSLNKEARDEFTEKIHDLVFDYQHNILQQVGFLDGLKLESKMKEVL